MISILTIFKSSKPDLSIFYGLMLLLIWAPLPLGSNRQWSWAILCFVAAFLMVSYLFLLLRKKIVLPPSIFKAKEAILLLITIQVWVAFQSIPLPIMVTELLTPEGVGYYHKIEGNIVSENNNNLNLNKIKIKTKIQIKQMIIKLKDLK